MKTYWPKYKLLKNLPDCNAWTLFELVNWSAWSYIEYKNWSFNFEDITNEWFEEVKEPDKLGTNGETIEGRTYYKLNPRITDAELIRAYLEKNKEGDDPITPENQASYFDKYRRAKGQPTSDIPVSETVKAGSQSVQYSQPKQTPKSQYSTGGLY